MTCDMYKANNALEVFNDNSFITLSGSYVNDKLDYSWNLIIPNGKMPVRIERNESRDLMRDREEVKKKTVCGRRKDLKSLAMEKKLSESNSMILVLAFPSRVFSFCDREVPTQA
jgi:hypothetical protein